ncbi:hypothetical protein [Robinsoniella peoriensis]|uniref:Uncharacterized protein n=1 Tax=Robinsoniella peoriensis TaxID=180332 RepID=A0A4U8QJA4_9FIRM|nr:hypothetical protein [Robinsoniella peoriensis]MDU7028131.1 hypothetical protein [Clostridiales bacterium]TLD01346.1 hypothetical protein DSM106044_01728 [Robinsoniella peoriensis]
MNQKYTVSLTEEERKHLHKLLNGNTLSVTIRKRVFMPGTDNSSTFNSP